MSTLNIVVRRLKRSVSVFFYFGCKTVLSNSRVLVHVSHSKDMSSSSNVMMKDRHLRCTQNIYEKMKIKSHKSKAWKTVVHEKEMLKKFFKNWADIFVMSLRKHRKSLTRSKYWSKSLAVQKRTWSMYFGPGFSSSSSNSFRQSHGMTTKESEGLFLTSFQNMKTMLSQIFRKEDL